MSIGSIGALDGNINVTNNFFGQGAPAASSTSNADPFAASMGTDCFGSQGSSVDKMLANILKELGSLLQGQNGDQGAQGAGCPESRRDERAERRDERRDDRVERREDRHEARAERREDRDDRIEGRGGERDEQIDRANRNGDKIEDRGEGDCFGDRGDKRCEDGGREKDDHRSGFSIPGLGISWGKGGTDVSTPGFSAFGL